MKSPQTLCLLAALAGGATATAAPLFSDDFNDAAISATKWNVFNGHYVGNDGNGDPYATDDFRVEWAYDYSALTYIFYQDAGDPGTTLPVPPAPKTKDGSMKGVRLQVNKFNDQPSLDAVNLYAKDLNATGDFVVRFDLFLNHPSWIDSGVGTTEYAMFGLNFAGTNVNWTSFGTAPGFLDSPAGQNSDGFYFMTTGDGGAARNQRLALGRAGGPALDPQIVTDIYPDISAQPVFPDRDGDGTADNLLRFSDYQAFKKRLFNTPKSEFAGVAGKRWIEIELRQYQGVVTWKMDGLIVAQFTNSTPFTAGTVMLGYMDIFASITGPGQEERDQQWALYDNLTVEPIRTVTVTSANNGSPAADGQTSLLEALTDLQDNDVIKFNIPAPNTGAVAISTPQAGYPLIEKQFVTIDGYSQPGAGPNTAAPPADNNAVIKIYLDSSAGPEQRTVLDFPGFGLSESAILGVLNARGFSASGLGFLSRFTAGSDEDADIYAIALVSDSPHAHIWGNRFGFFRQGDVILPNPDLPEVYGNHALFGGRSAVANFRDAATDPGRILYASPLTIGVDGDGYGDVGEGNIAIGHGIAFHLQTPDTRLSGNRINVFPDG
ncbi:MAG TPA: hypothetical protein PKE47_07415, partial [Verrucomicrobiota bacterium]|nr:hypothetical protein [Verrucomicrobiota bacterium]